ncbi:thiolase family protein [Rhodoferax sp.]|uniref:thiolase family protein n=1 Tax=Rhodoferax sp. TaxID=50421 RepID=UPI00262AA948|nr:thiolase family protein [Rhodoferax sp.]MDD2919645.1 thiolase family protein [Rhodoferax sp.]
MKEETMEIPERCAIISGIGQSAIGRRLGRGALDLTIEAALQAIGDAGLDRNEIDGVSTGSGYAVAPGASPVLTMDLKEALRLNLNWYGASSDSTQMSALINACMAVASGQARHVLVFRTVTEASARADVSSNGSLSRVEGGMQWRAPFGAPSAANWVGLIASRYAHEYGMTREQLAWIALNGRRNAVRTPNAVYRTPLTMEEYLESRMISTPLCLYDCDVPIDGSVAMVVSHVDTARDGNATPIHIEAISGPLYQRDTWDQQSDLTRFAAADAAKRLWSRTDLRPRDVDVAQLYDGFSFLALLWLEDMGFCSRGEAAAFVEGGHRIALDGELPINTSGGQLSFGRLHGMGLLHEACVQLRNLGGERQVPNQPRVALVTNGGGPVASAALLVRQ